MRVVVRRKQSSSSPTHPLLLSSHVSEVHRLLVSEKTLGIPSPVASRLGPNPILCVPPTSTIVSLYLCPKRMEAALRSASHDARLLSNRLERALGNRRGPLPVNAARAVTASLLAEGATQGDLDADTILLRLSDKSVLFDGLKRSSSGGGGQGTAIRADGDGDAGAETVIYTGASSSGSVGARTSSDDKQPVAPGLNQEEVDRTGAPRSGPVVAGAQAVTPALPQEVEENHMGGDDTMNHAGGIRYSGSGSGSGRGSTDEDARAAAVVVVDRSRLISMFAAKERLCAMANHLGSAEPIDTSSWLFPASLKAQRKPRALAAPPASPATNEATPSANVAAGFPLSSDVVAPGGERKASKRRAKSADDYPPLAYARAPPTRDTSSSGGSWLPDGVSSVTGWGVSRNKRSRSARRGGDAGPSESEDGRRRYEVAGLGGSKLGRSRSFAMGQGWHQMGRVVGHGIGQEIGHDMGREMKYGMGHNIKHHTGPEGGHDGVHQMGQQMERQVLHKGSTKKETYFPSLPLLNVAGR